MAKQRLVLIKNDIIDLLLEFDADVYKRLYSFLSYDNRARPFGCYANSVDCKQTLKVTAYPEWLYNTLCENTVSGWKIEPELLYGILTGDIPFKDDLV